jgi:hypothetical protein
MACVIACTVKTECLLGLYERFQFGLHIAGLLALRTSRILNCLHVYTMMLWTMRMKAIQFACIGHSSSSSSTITTTATSSSLQQMPVTLLCTMVV